MNQSLATFMKIALTVTVIVALLFMFGYKMVDTEISDKYAEGVIKHDNHGGGATIPHGLQTGSSPSARTAN